MLIAWQCIIHLFAFIGEQREFLPLHWASRTGQLDMVCFHLESTDVDCTDWVSLESCIVGYKDWANAVFQWRSTVNVKHQVMQCLQGRSEMHSLLFVSDRHKCCVSCILLEEAKAIICANFREILGVGESSFKQY